MFSNRGRAYPFGYLYLHLELRSAFLQDISMEFHLPHFTNIPDMG